MGKLNPFLIHKNIPLFISSEGVSALEKNALICFLEGNAAHLVGLEILLQIVMAVWHTSNLKKSAPNGLYYLQRLVTPD